MAVGDGHFGEHREGGGGIREIGFAQQRLDGTESVENDAFEQLLLAGEMAVERRRADCNGVGDVGHADVLVATGAKQVGGCRDDQLLTVGGPGPLAGPGSLRRHLARSFRGLRDTPAGASSQSQ